VKRRLRELLGICKWIAAPTVASTRPLASSLRSENPAPAPFYPESLPVAGSNGRCDASFALKASAIPFSPKTESLIN
jgi:hypothetical protein